MSRTGGEGLRRRAHRARALGLPGLLQRYRAGGAGECRTGRAADLFPCGWHISRDGQDRYSLRQRFIYGLFTFIGWATRMADISDQLRATEMIFGSDTAWTVVRGSALEEGESEGLPTWSAMPASSRSRPSRRSGKNSGTRKALRRPK